jgi:hypothetical protein
MAHLYTATKLLYPTAPKWPDMELLMYLQNPERLFFGGVPTTLDECYREVDMMAGKSALHSARNPRQDGKKVQKQGSHKRTKTKHGRWIAETSAVAPIFTERTTWSVTDEGVDTQVKLLFNKLRSPTELVHLARKLRMSSEVLEENLRDRWWRPYIEEQMNNENGPTALLRDLSMWLEGDEVDLHCKSYLYTKVHVKHTLNFYLLLVN